MSDNYLAARGITLGKPPVWKVLREPPKGFGVGNVRRGEEHSLSASLAGGMCYFFAVAARCSAARASYSEGGPIWPACFRMFAGGHAMSRKMSPTHTPSSPT